LILLRAKRPAEHLIFNAVVDACPAGLGGLDVVASANQGGREPEMMIPSGATRIGFVQRSSTMLAAIGGLYACGVPRG